MVSSSIRSTSVTRTSLPESVSGSLNGFPLETTEGREFKIGMERTDEEVAYDCDGPSPHLPERFTTTTTTGTQKSIILTVM